MVAMLMIPYYYCCYFSKLHSNLDFTHPICLEPLSSESTVIRCIYVAQTWLAELAQAHSHTYIIEGSKKSFTLESYTHILYTQRMGLFSYLLILEVPSKRSWEINNEIKNVFMPVAKGNVPLHIRLEGEMKPLCLKRKKRSFGLKWMRATISVWGELSD